ncbi:ubiquitin-associated domain-containing protein 1-like isoform X2 [Teleopsis dalmanni]|uniref:ubiquitin-associated domain-containing protein 1-like isoform X2 n=1 Tax=Teleopsis dalmanni TaxID=139649 RepID=UPI0018CE29C7|nr:ubiquitin-associated domain-containing protein 1-like isoform X2 [Teleopsis dalmanni]XP_037953305.1 ubiquitin-associated domain-containing protein 1-like isoform X2 [Teleopsis dalmanni]
MQKLRNLFSKRRSRRSISSSSSSSTNNSSSNSNDTVSDTSLTNERVRVRIICPSARILIYQTDVNKHLLEIKNEIIMELSDDMAAVQLFSTDLRLVAPRYRLFRAEFEGVELDENRTLKSLNIKNNDTLVLVIKRHFLANNMPSAKDMTPPRLYEVDMATRNLPYRVTNLPMIDVNEIFQQANLHFEVRKVLISLAQVSAIIVGASPYADRIIAMLKQKLINKLNDENDILQCLVDMGFTKERCEYALKTHNGVYASALEWLIQTQNDDLSRVEEVMGLQKSQSIMSPTNIVTNNDVLENIAALLEIVRIFSHRDMPPKPDTVNEITEMGFERNEVYAALKKTCNNKGAACEWLCGIRSPSLLELKEGLAQDSPLLQSILEMPQVQMSLGNPKILLTFVSILENESLLRLWGGDSDSSSVISNILQRYHDVKHALGMNQFYANRFENSS